MTYYSADDLAREFEDRKRVEQMANDSKKRESWLEAYRSVFERADRIVTGVPVKVVIAKTGPAPGWTDGQDIYLNGSMMDSKLQAGNTTELIMGIKGVNYHEVAHCIFMPRMGSKFIKEVQHRNTTRDGYWTTWNVLEDMRDETLFAGSFGTSVIYFTNMVCDWILDDPQNAALAWPLLNGRHYLPPKLRNDLRNVFSQLTKIDLDRLDEIADEFLGTVFPKDYDNALGMIDEYHDLLEQAGTDIGQDIDEPLTGGHGDDAPNSEKKKGRPVDTPTQEQAQENLEAARDEWDQQEFDDDIEEDLDDRDSIDASEKSEDQPEDDSDGGGVGEITPDEDSDESVEGDSGGGSSRSDPVDDDDADSDDLIDAVKEMVQDMHDEFMEEASVQEDVKDTEKAAQSELQDQEHKVTGRRSRHSLVSVSDDDAALKRVMTNHLQEILTDMAPQTINRQTSGYIDIRRAMTAPYGDLKIFKRFDEGHEGEATTEVVILLDQSISMKSIMDKASRVLWSLKGALDKVDIRTTVFGFSDTHELLLPPEDKMQDQYRSFGSLNSTNPDSALYEAKKILESSPAENLVVIIITDGGWMDSTDFVLTRNALRKLGTTLGIIQLNDPSIKPAETYSSDWLGDHGFDVMITVDPNHLEQAGLAVERIVSEIMAGLGV